MSTGMYQQTQISVPMALTPEFKWAQDKEHLFLTIDIVGCKDQKTDLKENILHWSGTVDGKGGKRKYSLELEFLKPIVVAESKYSTKRNVEFLLSKKDKDEEFWGRLLKDKNKYKSQCKIDFDKWRDEDE
eukprot:g82615.t1